MLTVKYTIITRKKRQANYTIANISTSLST